MLHEFQSKLKAPKGQYNSFGKYKYRSAEDIVEAVKPIINAAGYSLNLTDEIVLIGNRFYVKATATITNGEKTFSATAYAREEETRKGMDASQITGSVSSYARKYALNGLFAIDDTKDADATNDHGKAEETKSEPKPEKKSRKLSVEDFSKIMYRLGDPIIPVTGKGEMNRGEYVEYIKANFTLTEDQVEALNQSLKHE